MKLSECKMGEVVINATDTLTRIGHIVGLAKNSCGETVPLVKYSDSDISIPSHHNNLQLLSEYEKKYVTITIRQAQYLNGKRNDAQQDFITANVGKTFKALRDGINGYRISGLDTFVHIYDATEHPL